MKDKYVQVTFETHDWMSPDRSFRYNFAIIEPESEIGNYAGLVIISDEFNENATITQVSNIEKELPNLLANESRKAIVYWRMVEDQKLRKEIHEKLTDHPVFYG